MENQQITVTQSTHLSQISQSALVRNLLENRFDLIPAPVDVAEAVQKGTPMVVLQRVAHEENLLLAIEFEILSAAGRLNLNPNLTIKPGQAPLIAKVIFDQFKTESLGDLKLAFLRGSTGLYGEIFRLDGAVFVKWIQAYLEEKYAEVEKQHAKLKQDQKEMDDNFDYSGYYDRVREWAEKKREIDDEKKRLQAQERQKEALFRMQQISATPRPKFIVDGIEVTAKDEHYARLAYKDTFGKEPQSVTLKPSEEPESVTEPLEAKSRRV